MKGEMDDWWPDTTPHVGAAQASSDDEPPSAAEIAGVLIVPDVEQRHGWREYYVRREQKPNARPIGFGRR